MAEIKIKKPKKPKKEKPLTSPLSKPWQNFIKKLSDNTVPLKDWKEVNLLGYCCERYHQHYEQDYILSFVGSPGKCQEIQLIKRIMMMLGTKSPKINRDYVDWVFENKIIGTKINMRTFAFLATPGFGTEFMASRKKKIDKTTILPPEYQQVADVLEISASTYGELAFIKLSMEQSEKPIYKELFSTLQNLGFEISILSTLV